MRNIYLVAGYSTLAVGLCAWHGQDLNWDLLNYHFYNPYMWLNGRLESDVHAAGVQSFLNPLVDLPLYVAVRLGVPPPLFYLSLAAVHGLVPFFVHRITTAMFPRASTSGGATASVLAGTTAAFGAGFQAEVGNTMHDNTLSILVLASLWLIVVRFDRVSRSSRRAILLAGVLAGSAVGMKLSMAPLCLGLFAAVLVLPGDTRTRVTHALWFSVAVGLGLVVTGGYWMWLMYRHFESPIFPFFNTFFQSPFAPVQDFSDTRYLPKTILQTVSYPFYWVSTQDLVTGVPFRDARFAVVLVFLPVLCLQRLFSLAFRETADAEPLSGKLFLIAVFWVVSYVVWLKMFSIYRYVIALEALSAVFIIGVSAVLVQRWTKSLALAFPVCIAVSCSVLPPNYGRIPWSDSYFGVDEAKVEEYAGATILMWDFPRAYLVPLFPPSATFVRLVSNWGLQKDTTMWRRVIGSITVADNSRLYLLDGPLYEGHDQQSNRLASLGLGLQRTAVACKTYPSHHGGFRLCPLERVTP